MKPICLLVPQCLMVYLHLEQKVSAKVTRVFKDITNPSSPPRLLTKIIAVHALLPQLVMYTVKNWSFCDTSNCSSVLAPASRLLHDVLNMIHFLIEGKLLAFKVTENKMKTQKYENKHTSMHKIQVHVYNKNLHLKIVNTDSQFCNNIMQSSYKLGMHGFLILI